MTTHEGESVHGLEAEVALELDITRSSDRTELADETPAEWLFDPEDVERQEIGLENIQGALQALEVEPPR